MRTLAPILAVLAVSGSAFFLASAQEVGQEVVLTGCLAQEAEEGEEAEFVLEGFSGLDADAVELIPAEGVNLAPHVGHTVEVTGVVVQDDDAMGEGEEGEAAEAEEEDENEVHVRVDELGHLSASCEEA